MVDKAPDLSILIPSLHSRAAQRLSLLVALSDQPNELLSRCQVLVDIDNGTVSIGTKRNRLLDAALGRYIVFIDDDDMIAPTYLRRIFEGIDLDVDHVGVGMLFDPPDRPNQRKRVICSKEFAWGETDQFFLRSPQHTCAVKRDIARRVGFPEISFGEDREYSQLLRHLVETEYVIEEPIYYYQYRSEK